MSAEYALSYKWNVWGTMLAWLRQSSPCAPEHSGTRGCDADLTRVLLRSRPERLLSQSTINVHGLINAVEIVDNGYAPCLSTQPK
nr:hypothetical protein HmN_000401000 [Hymenolepis microstoma]